jgi:FlaA1/EpsC-like NDP-sugar epimerase
LAFIFDKLFVNSFGLPFNSGVLFLIALIIAVTLRPNFPQVPFLVPVDELSLPLWVYSFVPTLWILVFLVMSVYDPKGTYRLVDELQTVSLASLLAALICAGIFYLFFREFSRWLFISFIFFDIVLLLGWRVIARLIWRMVRFPAAERRVLIIGAGKLGQQVGMMIEEYWWTGLSLVGYLDDDPDTTLGKGASWLGKVGDVQHIVQERQISDVVIALPQYAFGIVNDLVLKLQDLPLLVRVVPDYYSLAIYQATVEDFAGMPMINLRDPALNEFQ